MSKLNVTCEMSTIHLANAAAADFLKNWVPKHGEIKRMRNAILMLRGGEKFVVWGTATQVFVKQRYD